MRYTEQQSLTQIRFVQFTGLWATDRFHWSVPFPLAYACHAKNVQGLILCNINDFVSS